MTEEDLAKVVLLQVNGDLRGKYWASARMLDEVFGPSHEERLMAFCDRYGVTLKPVNLPGLTIFFMLRPTTDA
jgi:hypothetical protein